MKRPDVDRNPTVSVRTPNGLERREIWESKGLDRRGFGEICESRESCLMCSDSHESDEMKRYPPEVKEALSGVKFVADHLRSADKDNLVSFIQRTPT